MNLTQTGMPGYFQITAEDDQFIVAGNNIHQNDSAQVEFLIGNLADMLDHAMLFAKDPDMVDRILDAHGLMCTDRE
jgi:hypothetical protein